MKSIILRKYIRLEGFMSSKINTLFVFEGETTEGNIISKLEKYFMGESIAIKCVSFVYSGLLWRREVK